MAIKRIVTAMACGALLVMAAGNAHAYTYEMVLSVGNPTIEAAERALRDGRLGRAATYFNKALNQNLSLRSTRRSHNGLCVTLYFKRAFDEALEHCNRAISLMPNRWDTFNNRGNIYLELGEYEKAVADYQTALRLRPSSGVPAGNIEIALRRASGAGIEIMPAFSEGVGAEPDGLMNLDHLASVSG